jgi:hypothetical protein
VTIIGETFKTIAAYESEGLGLRGLPVAVVEYPMGGVPTEEAVQRAYRAFDQILAGLTRPPLDNEEASQ